MEVLVLAAAAFVTATAAWTADRRRCRRRNKQAKCGSCGASWAETPSREPYLIHGRLVCEACAEKAKRRIPWQFGTLAVAAAVATGGMVAGFGIVAMVLFPVATTIVMTFGAVQVMKLANSEAQRLIAEGEFPDFEALGTENSTHQEQRLSEGPAV